MMRGNARTSRARFLRFPAFATSSARSKLSHHIGPAKEEGRKTASLGESHRTINDT